MSRQIIDNWQDYRQAVVRLLGMAPTTIAIYDEDLGELSLETPGNIALLQTILASHAEQPLRIALRQGESFQNRHPRLGRLLQTWQHRCGVRGTPANLAHLRDSMVLSGPSHGLIRFEKDLPRSVLLIDEAPELTAYRERFESIWNSCDENLLQTPLGL